MVNLIDAEVIEVLGEPDLQREIYDGRLYEWWEIEVKSIDMGGTQIEMLSFNTREEALKVKVGYKFLH